LSFDLCVLYVKLLQNQGQSVATFWISLKTTCITKAKQNQEEIVKKENIKIGKVGIAYRANLTSFRSQTNDSERAFFQITGYTKGQIKSE
jgi:hypothetical protein